MKTALDLLKYMNTNCGEAGDWHTYGDHGEFEIQIYAGGRQALFSYNNKPVLKIEVPGNYPEIRDIPKLKMYIVKDDVYDIDFGNGVFVDTHDFLINSDVWKTFASYRHFESAMIALLKL